MSENNHKKYVEEILYHVLAHTQQMLTQGCCNCCSGIDNPNNIQTICLPVDRLESIMRGEPQYFKKAHPASIYEYQWLENPLNKDGNEPF